jgi:hypothetical protein
LSSYENSAAAFHFIELLFGCPPGSAGTRRARTNFWIAAGGGIRSQSGANW